MCVECALTVKSVPSFRRLWNKADFTAIDTPIQDLWDAYKAMCLICLSLLNLSPQANVINPAWANPFIRRLSSKKQCLYNRSDLLEDISRC